MILRDSYKIMIKNLLIGLVVCPSFLSASNLQVKIINNAVPVAFVIVRTELGSNHRKLYVSSESSKLSSDDWRSALENMQNEIEAVILAANGDSVTVTNASQNIRQYDRVLWVIPLSTKIQENLHTLGLSVQHGRVQSPTVGGGAPVVVSEIGSAKTVTISGNEKALKISTTGKLKEGAKALFKSTESTPPSTAEAGGFAIQTLVSGSALPAIKQKLGYRETAKTFAKPPKPSRKTQKDVAATDDPDGWPTRDIIRENKNIKTYRSFKQAVNDLKLPDIAIEDLRNYSTLVGKRQKMLDYINKRVQTNQTDAKRNAWLLIKEYASYHDDIPFGVR